MTALSATEIEGLNDISMTGEGVSWRFQNHTGTTDSPTHWQSGRSAKSAADLRFTSNAIPTSLAGVMAIDARFAGAQLLDAIVARGVDPGDGKQPSQTDVMGQDRHPVSISVLRGECLLQRHAEAEEAGVHLCVEQAELCCPHLGPARCEWLHGSHGLCRGA